MSVFLTRFLRVCALLSLNLFAEERFEVPELVDLQEPWLFVRASEASTLFMDENFKEAAPFGHLALLSSGVKLWTEFDGRKTEFWIVLSSEKREKQWTLELQPLAKPKADPERLVIYPYWDIDQCLVMIRFVPGAAENPVHFATPYEFKDSLPYLAPEG